jgi:transcriptional regulator with XRE-family HTH domain
MKIGDRIKAEREKLGFNQDDFAEKGGVSRRSQIMYEQNKTEASAGYFTRIAEIGADVSYILTGVRSQIVQNVLGIENIDVLEDVKKPPIKVVARNLGELGVSEEDLSLARMINRLPEAQKNSKIADIETLLRSNYEAIQDWLARDGNMKKVA